MLQRIYFEDESLDSQYEKSYNETYDSEDSYKFQNALQTKSNDFQKMKFEQFEKITIHTIISKFALKCRNCDVMFYSNNKFHRHLRRNCKPRTKIYHIDQSMMNYSIIDSSRKLKASKEYVFTILQNAIAKIVLNLTKTLHDMCMNSEIFLSLINQHFIQRKRLDLKIKKINTIIKIREIDDKIHDNSKYVKMNLYIFEKIKNNSCVAHLKTKFHLINTLKINVLLETNMLISEKMILNFVKKILIITTCEVMKVSIQIERKKKIVNKSIRIHKTTIISKKFFEAMFVQIKNKQFSNDKNYNFFFIVNEKLDSKDEFFAHVIKSNVKTIQIRNTVEGLIWVDVRS